MTRQFAASTLIARAPADVFDWVADYRNVPTVLEGVSRWDPVGSRTRGSGAEFDVEMGTLGVNLANRLVLDAWDRPRRIGWKSRSGLIAQTGRWTFTPSGGGTAVELQIAYDPPGGGVGGLLAGAVEGLVKNRLAAALERMRRVLEAE